MHHRIIINHTLSGASQARLVEIGYAITIAITMMTKIARTVSFFFNLVGLPRNYAASEKKFTPIIFFKNTVAVEFFVI